MARRKKATKKTKEVVEDVVIIDDEQQTPTDDQAPTETEETSPEAPEETTQEAPEEVDVESEETEEDVAEAPSENDPPEEKQEEKKPSVNVGSQYLEVWIETFKQGNEANTLAALLNFVNAVKTEKDGRHLNKVIREIRENKVYFNPKFIFTGINSIPMSKRAEVESVITALMMVADGKKSSSLSVDTLRNYVKNDDFINFIASKLE